MIIIKSVDRADIFISTKEIAQLNEKMNNDDFSRGVIVGGVSTTVLIGFILYFAGVL